MKVAVNTPEIFLFYFEEAAKGGTAHGDLKRIDLR
jgi:hypothetical protein